MLTTVQAESTLSTHGLSAIRDLVANDFTAVNALITARLVSNVPLINEIARHIIHSGGKRLRPLLALLSAKAFQYEGQDHLTLAAVIEFIHTATLLHDDVVDSSKLRRGKFTANAIWGNQASVLVGDFLYSRAFQLLTDMDQPRIMAVLAETTNTIAEGEVLQLMNCRNVNATQEDYFRVIHCKTAKLFEAAAHIGAIIADAAAAQTEAIARYGLHLGLAFQLVDDILDYSADVSELGKNIGDDLAEGKPTLPLIYAMRYGSLAQADIIRKAIENGGLENLAAITDIIADTQALTYVRQLAEDQAQLAINAIVTTLPPTAYRDGLINLAKFAVERHS